MSAATLLPPRKRFTRTEVEQMLDAGLFAGQRFELIDGDLIDKMGQEPPHAYTIQRLLVVLGKIFGAERTLVQMPIEVGSELCLPEPDLAVLAEARGEYGRRHPRGDELLLAIEVADTTLPYDTTFKRDLYARAGVPEYWVLAVVGRRLIVYRNPSQGKFGETYSLAERASVEVGPGLSIPVSEMLPS